MSKITLIDLRDQFFKVSNNVFKKDLNIYEIGVYTAICRFVNNESKMAYPSLNKIAELLNISKRQVIRSIKTLCEKEIIYKKQGQTNICNQYYLIDIRSDQEALVTESHPGGDQESPQVVTDRHPKKTNIKRLNKKTYISKEDLLFKYNSLANKYNLPIINKITDDRYDKYKKRFDEGLRIKEIFDHVANSEFLRITWKLTFDWLIKNNTNWLKIIEGNYDDKQKIQQVKQQTFVRKYCSRCKKNTPHRYFIDKFYCTVCEKEYRDQEENPFIEEKTA